MAAPSNAGKRIGLLFEGSNEGDYAPDFVVLQLVFEGHHVEIWSDAVLDVGENLAVGRAVIPLVAEQARRGRNQVVARAALSVASVARGAVA